MAGELILFQTAALCTREMLAFLSISMGISFSVALKLVVNVGVIYFFVIFLIQF